MKKILFISAHADDAVVAVGGIMAYYIQKDWDLYYLAFSIAEESVPKKFEKNILEKECREATNYLGISPEKVHIKHFKVRTFPDYRQDILDILIKFRKTLNPEVVFTPSTQDIHQDHKVVCDETIRAFMRSSSIYGYDFPWNILYEAKLNLFFELNERLLEKKIIAIQFFKSQLIKSNNCLTPKYIRSLAIERGNRIGKKYAEALEVIREIRGIKE